MPADSTWLAKIYLRAGRSGDKRADRRELCPIAGSFSQDQFFAFRGGRLGAPVQFEYQIQAIRSISVYRKIYSGGYNEPP